MFGAVRKRDILAHPCVTIRCFGWSVFFRALVAGRDRTFLSLLADTSAFRTPTRPVPEILGRCVGLESGARRIYEVLAERFHDREPVGQFFRDLAQQEDEHAEMLELCRELAGREGWLERVFAPWAEAVPRLEQAMGDAERSLADVKCVEDGLLLVLEIEGSEVNQLFEAVIGATDSGFVRYLRPFQSTVAKHLEYICARIPQLEPGLAGQCDELRTDHPDELVG
jgi:hypothetical protein